MSTDTVVGGRRVEILTRASRLARVRLEAGCELLEVTAEWIVANPGDGLQPQDTRLEFAQERAMVWAGDGTPAVAETAPATLGLEIGLSVWQSCRLVADVLDLRYRLPQIWSMVGARCVRPEYARLVAGKTRILTLEQAAAVDAELATLISTVSYGGLLKAIDAAMLRADPVGYKQRAESAARWRGVRLGRETEDGLVDVHARVDAPDGIGYVEVVQRFGRRLSECRDRLPDCVPDRDPQSAAEWEALAFAILKTPFVACRVLLELGCPDLLYAAVDLFTDTDTDRPQNDPTDNEPAGDPADVDHAADHDAADHNTDNTAHADHTAGVDHDDAGRAVDHQSRANRTDGDRTDGDRTDGDRMDGSRSEAGQLDRDHPGDRPADDHDTAERPTDDQPHSAPKHDRDRDAARDRALRALIRQINPSKLLPLSVLHVHIGASAIRGDNGIARVEGIGPQLGDTVRRWLGTGTKLHVAPVIDPESISAVDRYEVPDWMREALLARNPRSVFPFSNTINRLMEVDHTIAYLPPPAGPPGQTGGHNLGPLATPEHRVKTFGTVRVRQVEPGTFLWHTETGRLIITNPAGTHDLGTGSWAQQLWTAATTSAPHQQVT